MYLLDTNILILALAGHSPEAEFCKHAIEKNQVRLSVVVIAEFLTRASVLEKKALDKLTAVFPVLFIDLATARLAAQLRKASLKKTRVSMLDCLLTAQAKQYNLTLVTNNLADFPKKEIKILSFKK